MALGLYRYDQGCQDITNIDFSKPVILEMMRKNLRARPAMKWQVMDMIETKVSLPDTRVQDLPCFWLQHSRSRLWLEEPLHLQHHCTCMGRQLTFPDQVWMQFGDKGFDIILDKGSLDALMGEDSPESLSAGRRYLKETARLLRASGSFLCITLGQKHVLRAPRP